MMTRLQATVTKLSTMRRAVVLGSVLAAAIAISVGGSFRSTAAVPTGPERSLAGIRIYSPAALVLKKYGNPSNIITGDSTIDTSGNASPSGGKAGMPPMPTPAPGNEFGGGAGGTSGGASSGGNDQAVNEVTYRYVAKDGNKMDFLLSPDGRVIQITASGFKNPIIKTSKGITLGSSYLDVINKYGYPESQQNTNGIITMKYTDRAHVAFQVFQNKVVSITVAAVE